jgi:hypothetical protein
LAAFLLEEKFSPDQNQLSVGWTSTMEIQRITRAQSYQGTHSGMTTAVRESLAAEQDCLYFEKAV